MAAQAQAHREREAAMQADIDGKAVQIEEATICLAARKETEGRLHAEAAAMLSALDASVAEGERLHTELRRCATEEQQRRDAAKSFCAESCAALESLQSAAATYAAEAQEQQKKLTALASEAVEQGKSEASKMQAGMATLLESVQSGVESVNGTMGERCAAGAAELQAAAQAQAAAVSALVETVGKATEGVGSSLEAAVAKIKSADGETQRWGEAGLVRLAAAADALAALQSASDKAVSDTQSSLDQVRFNPILILI